MLSGPLNLYFLSLGLALTALWLVGMFGLWVAYECIFRPFAMPAKWQDRVLVCFLLTVPIVLTASLFAFLLALATGGDIHAL